MAQHKIDDVAKCPSCGNDIDSHLGTPYVWKDLIPVNRYNSINGVEIVEYDECGHCDSEFRITHTYGSDDVDVSLDIE